MIENINDDCQFIIIKCLDYNSQFCLWVASKEFAPRLHRNVSHVLQRRSSHVLDYNYWFGKSVRIPIALEENFLSIICSTVEHLSLKSVTLPNLKRLMKHSFPCVRSLEYRPDKVDGTEHAEAQQVLVKLFPELTSFTPFGPIDGNIEKWKLLETLDLSKCKLFSKGLSLHKFQDLEHLTISLYYFNDISIDSILSLPKLRKFSFSTACTQNKQFLTKIIDQRGMDICEMTFRFIDWTWSLDKLQELKNLRQLTLIDDLFNRAYFKVLIKSLPALERINMIGGQFWYHERELWDAVESCSSLKVLNLSDTLIDDEFYDPSRRHMQTVLNNRSLPLLMHCYNTGEDERDPAECKQLINQHFDHQNLIVSFKQLKVDEIPFQYTKIHFS